MTLTKSQLDYVREDLEPKLQEVRESYDKVVKFIEENKFLVTESTNAKLHDASFVTGDDDYLNDLFDQFCEDEWRYFTERYEGDVNIQSVGRTSSFYLLPTSDSFPLIVEAFEDNASESDLIYEIVSTYVGWPRNYDTLGSDIDVALELVKTELDGWEDDYDSFEEAYEDSFLHRDYEDLASDLEESLVEMTEDVRMPREAWDYLEEFKNNQVSNFRNYVGEDAIVHLTIDEIYSIISDYVKDNVGLSHKKGVVNVIHELSEQNQVELPVEYSCYLGNVNNVKHLYQKDVSKFRGMPQFYDRFAFEIPQFKDEIVVKEIGGLKDVTFTFETFGNIDATGNLHVETIYSPEDEKAEVKVTVREELPIKGFYSINDEVVDDFSVWFRPDTNKSESVETQVISFN